VLDNGAVYAWGSNRFGQLGYSTATTASDASGTLSRCCLPRRIDDLWKKNISCVSVAAGEKHGVALSVSGEVYVWGCNSAGQLGVSHRRSTSNSGMAHKVQRVDALWNNERRKVCIQIAASAQSTLVLAKPTTGGLPVNQVIAWGHGNHVPSKVHFSEEQRDSERSMERNPFLSSASRRSINPVAIACAGFHNVAISADGRGKE
jgi:alpha-tubulin suppressor-like RCC1 family protein